MPKSSRANVSQVKDFGVAEDRSEELGGYTVNFVSILADYDLGPMLSGLFGATVPALKTPGYGYWELGPSLPGMAMKMPIGEAF